MSDETDRAAEANFIRHFGKNIKQILKSLGLSQTELAKALKHVASMDGRPPCVYCAKNARRGK